MGVIDRAKYLATLFLEDIGDFITEHVDDNFGFSRYAERIGIDAVDFDKVMSSLFRETVITRMMCDILDDSLRELNPHVVAFSIPFPGNLLSALKGAQFIRERYPHIAVVFGGGYVNTELRSLNEPRLFELVDYVCLDDGELTLHHLLNFLLRDGGKTTWCGHFSFVTAV